MIFTETTIPGAYWIDPEPAFDERGFFARTWCRREFAERGLSTEFVQSSISFNRRRGTLRGLHFQASPHDESKLVRCTRGAVYDVIVDLRPDSPSFQRWEAVELTAENHRQLYIPSGVAHGFQTLADESEVYYQMTTFYVSDATRGVRFDDPALAIAWPETVTMVSARDRSYGDFHVPA